MNSVIISLLVPLAWSVAAYPYWPQTGCTIASGSMTCVSVIPASVPSGITEVVLRKLHPSQVSKACVFCNKTWVNVKQLMLTDDDGGYYNIDGLSNHLFTGLDNLVNLTIHLQYLSKLSLGVFSGLEQLNMLDMSDCQTLSINYISNALSNSSILPHLIILILHNVNTVDDNMNTLTEETFREFVNGRNITGIDLSSTRFMFEKKSINKCIMSVYPLCETVKMVNISDTFIVHTSSHEINVNPALFVTCTSLVTLDISGLYGTSKYQITRNQYYIKRGKTITYDDNPGIAYFVNNVVTLIAMRLSKSAPGMHLYFYDCVANLSLTWAVKHVDFSHNRIKWLDSIAVSDYIRLESLYLSHNDMEYVTPMFFQQAIISSLKKLDISHNMLSRMESNETELETLFSSLDALEVLSLSNNNFSQIPPNMFAHNTNLKVLDISNNQLTHVTFAIVNLMELRYVDISGNDISILDSVSINNFNYIYSKQIRDINDRLRLNVHNNPLKCSSCADVNYVEWMYTSPVVIDTDRRYECVAENKESKIIGQDTVSYTQYLCDREMILKRTIIMATLIPIASVTLIVLISIYILKSLKIKRVGAHVDDRRRRIEDDDYEFKYPIFLSYSSVDDGIVLEHLYPELQDHLRAFCRTDRELVCIGDRHFRPGLYIADEVARSLEMSGLLVVVMSANYCHSDWCIAELHQAYQLRKPVLIISIEQVAEREIPVPLRGYFQSRVRIKFAQNADDAYAIIPEWENVCHSILRLLP